MQWRGRYYTLRGQIGDFIIPEELIPSSIRDRDIKGEFGLWIKARVIWRQLLQQRVTPDLDLIRITDLRWCNE